MLILGHEVGHAYDHHNGANQYNSYGNENTVVNFGNYLRSVCGETPLRTEYSPHKFKFRNKESGYNPEQEKITNFKEINSFSEGDGETFGYSFDVSENGEEAQTYYIFSAKDESGKYHFTKFDNKEDYDKRIEEIED